MIWPATCAPTSTTSTGSIVPVAVIVAMRSPRFTAATRKEDLGLFRACTHQLPTATTKIAAQVNEAVLLQAKRLLPAIPQTEPEWVARAEIETRVMHSSDGNYQHCPQAQVQARVSQRLVRRFTRKAPEA